MRLHRSLFSCELVLCLSFLPSLICVFGVWCCVACVFDVFVCVFVFDLVCSVFVV